MFKCFLKHSWGKWSDAVEIKVETNTFVSLGNGTSTTHKFKSGQTRFCLVCNKIAIRKIK